MAKGSIYPYDLADGSRRYMAVYRSSNGIQKKKKGFRGVRGAERFLNKTMADVDAGRVVATRDTFASYIDRWLAEHRPRIEEGTYRDYRVHVERRLKPFFGDLKLGDIEPTHVRRYVADLVEGAAPGAVFGAEGLEPPLEVAERLGTFTVSEFAGALAVTQSRGRHTLGRLERSGQIARHGVRAPPGRRGRSAHVYRVSLDSRRAGLAGDPKLISAKTINNSLIPLRVALGHAVEDGLIARNPAASAAGARDRIKVSAAQPEIDFLRLAEIPLYLDACSPEYRPLAEVLIACGLRISEAVDLVWANVDFEGSILSVLTSRKARAVSGSTKGDRFRGVEFGPRIEQCLRDLRARRSEHDGADGNAQPVFGTADGGKLDRRAPSGGAHKEALEDAGLRPSLRLHDLRHTAAASWLAAGLPLIYVQRQLGPRFDHDNRAPVRSIWKRASSRVPRGAPRRLSGSAASTLQQS